MNNRDETMNIIEKLSLEEKKKIVEYLESLIKVEEMRESINETLRKNMQNMKIDIDKEINPPDEEKTKHLGSLIIKSH